MELIRASALTRYRSKVRGSAPLFDGLSWALHEGERVGLVGPNGSGKSTLLRLLAGSERPLEGRVVRAPGVRVALLAQSASVDLSGSVWRVASAGLGDLASVEGRLAVEEARIAAGEERRDQWAHLRAEFERLGGYGAEALVREILAALGFPKPTHGRSVERLSSGQRQRLALASVLSSGADLLLLDEPSNHLDLVARSWLEQHLTRRSGALVIVSHDRAMLAATTSRTAFLEAGSVRLVDAPYERAKQRRLSTATARRESARAQEDHRLERMAAELSSFAGHRGRTSRSSRHRGTGQAGAPEEGKALRGRLLSAAHVSLPGVLEDAEIRLEAGDRIALMGPNGSGKSSVLTLLAGERASEDPRFLLEYPAGLKLVWLAQESRGLQAGRPLLDQARELLGEGRAKRVLADAGVPHHAWDRPPEELSGGERARAGLALALARPFDLLLLDEPDNDLDLEALEAFEAALRERLEVSSAALVIVTHDRRLALNLASRVWTVQDGALMANGSVRAYLRGEEPRPAKLMWEHASLQGPRAEGDRAKATFSTAETVSSATRSETETLEEERTALLETLLDPLAQSERERQRTRERLAVVEGSLMAIYDERLQPAGPSRRVVERGLVVYADVLVDEAHDADRHPEHHAEDDSRWAALSAADPATARAALRRPEAAGTPWLELRRKGDVAHLQLHEPADTRVLPWARGALLDAGTRLAFTVLGVRSVQHFDRQAPAAATEARDRTARHLSGGSVSPRASRPSGPRLKAAGDGWWRLSLEEFLALEGWRVTRPPRARRSRRGSERRGEQARARDRARGRERGRK